MSPAEYILDPRFELHLMAAYDPHWNKPVIVTPGMMKTFLAHYPPETTTVVSHNALFDLAILAWKYNYIPRRLADTLGMARALLTLPHGYSLHKVGEALRLGGKHGDGAVLRATKGMHLRDIRNSLLWSDFITYAKRDVMICAGIYSRLLPSFPSSEQRIMDLVLRCAIEPVLRADIPLLANHVKHLRRSKEQWLQEAGHDKKTIMSQIKFEEELKNLGVDIEYKISTTGNKIPCFAKTDPFMISLQEYYDGPDDDTNFAVQCLASARLAHRSTIEETRAERFLKVAQLPWQQPSMLPVPLRYGGAHTHRLAGEWSMNMQNLPRDRTKSRLRRALLAPPGFKIMTADLSQIECRLTARFCGETELLDDFKLNEDVYAKFASFVFGHAVTRADNPAERFIGKTAVLGLGYGCGAPKFFNMVKTQAQQGSILLDGFGFEFAEHVVSVYRRTYPHIGRMWRLLGRLLDSIIFGSMDERDVECVTIRKAEIVLPNGLTLRYDQAQLIQANQHLYGAKLLENIIQALARNVVMEAALRLNGRGYRFVMQSHDELVFVVKDQDIETAKSVIKEEMTRELAWLLDVPIAVDIGIGPSYGECK